MLDTTGLLSEPGSSSSSCSSTAGTKTLLLCSSIDQASGSEPSGEARREGAIDNVFGAECPFTSDGLAGRQSEGSLKKKTDQSLESFEKSAEASIAFLSTRGVWLASLKAKGTDLLGICLWL